MISPTKTYRTRNGMDARVYSTDGAPPFCVHGAMYLGDAWVICSWDKDGRINDDDSHPRSLVEVKPRIKRTVWVNLYPVRGSEIADSEHDAELMACIDRIACVPIQIDCDEGEGIKRDAP